jgi:glucose-1-phosphate thymidylyltransferase
MKGIVLAGGNGTRLRPITQSVSKQLLPVYDKPMIYYSIASLMLMGINEILIISKPEDRLLFENLLENGNRLGMKIEYTEQPEPKGIAEALIIGESFIGDDNVCLILGDNLLYGSELESKLYSARKISEENKSAVIFATHVKDPERYGVVEYDGSNNVLGIEEKPNNPKSNYAVIGIYIYPKGVSEIAKTIEPSGRGELEITTLNQYYLKENRLNLTKLGRGYAWFDTGTFDSLLEASNYVKSIEERQGLKVACIEEIAIHKKFKEKEYIKNKSPKFDNEYYQYVQQL